MLKAASATQTAAAVIDEISTQDHSESVGKFRGLSVAKSEVVVDHGQVGSPVLHWAGY